MGTRYETCPTCSAQSNIAFCDNCKNDIPAGTNPGASGRVWDENLQGYVGVDLCTTCAAQDVNLMAIVTPAPEPEAPSEPVPTPTEPGATPNAEPA